MPEHLQHTANERRGQVLLAPLTMRSVHRPVFARVVKGVHAVVIIAVFTLVGRVLHVFIDFVSLFLLLTRLFPAICLLLKGVSSFEDRLHVAIREKRFEHSPIVVVVLDLLGQQIFLEKLLIQ